MSSAPVLLEASGLCKRFGERRVVASLSLSFSVGEVVLILGANGAGKSTLLRMLAGLSRPDSGTVRVPAGARRDFVSHQSFLYGQLSLEENIRLYSSLLGVSRDVAGCLLAEWGLSSFLRTPVRQLSKGTLAKASIVRALVGEPRVLLLDEPSSNLDEKGVESLRAAVLARASTGVALVATHDVERLRSVANRVVVLESGACIGDSGFAASSGVIDALIEQYYRANR